MLPDPGQTSQSTSSTPILPDPLLRVRLTRVTTSALPPDEGLDQLKSNFSGGKTFEHVPIIRVMGVTEGGQKACVNVHGAFPYFYIDYPKDQPIDPDSVKSYTNRLAKALNVVLGRRSPDEAAPKTANVIQSINLVKGTPIYGYRVGYSYFLRIAYLRPPDRYKLIEVLNGGAILAYDGAVYEGHLSFVLQWMCDFGLGGCGWLDIKDARFRSLPVDDPFASPDSQMLLPSHLRRWTSNSTPDAYLHPDQLPRTSRTMLEIDIHVSSIINRLRIQPRPIHHDFVELLSGHKSERKLVDSLEELWEQERERMAAAGKSVDGEKRMGKLSYGERIGRANDEPGKEVEWGSNSRWWAFVEERIQADRELFEEQRRQTMEDYPEATPTTRLRTLQDMLEKASGRPDTKDQLAKWDKYIPTTFHALVRGWPSSPMPSRAADLLPAQTQHMPAPVKTMDDAQGLMNVTPSKNVFSDNPKPPGMDDVDEALVFRATQRASQLEQEATEEMFAFEEEFIELLRRDGQMPDDPAPEGDGQSEEEEWLEEGETELEVALSQLGGRGRSRVKFEGGSVVSSRAAKDESDTGAPRAAPSSSLRMPISQAAYPHAEYFSSNSTKAQRKSRSPLSAVRISPLKLGMRKGTTPNSPSTLRTVRFLAPGEGALDGEGEDGALESPSKGSLGVKNKPRLALPHKPTQPDFGLPPRNTTPGSKQISSISSSALGADRPLASFQFTSIPPTFIPPTYPLSLSPLPSPPPSTRPNYFSQATAISPPLSDGDETGESTPSSLEDVGASELVPTYKSLQATSDPSQQFTCESTSPESDMIVMQESIDTTPIASPASSVATVLASNDVLEDPKEENDNEQVRPRKRVRYADEVLDGGRHYRHEEEVSLESAIPAAQVVRDPDLPIRTPRPNAPDLVVVPESSSHLSSSFDGPDISVEMTAPLNLQPSASGSAASNSYGPPGVHRGPYYSKSVDVPARAYEHGGRSWKLGTHTREEEEEPFVDVHGDQVGTFLGKMKEEVAAKRLKRKRRDGEEMNEAQGWEFGFEAPTKGGAEAWLRANGEEKEERRRLQLESQHAGHTQKNTQGFKFSQVNESSRHREKRHMSVMVLELMIKTREGCLPVPELDPIIGAFFAFQSDGEVPDNCYVPGTNIGMVLVDPKVEGEISRKDPRRLLKEDVAPTLVKSELDLINTIVERVWEWDPDILSGWEVQTASWGFVTHRMGTYAAAEASGAAQEAFIRDLSPLLDPRRRSASQYDGEQHSLFQVEGRHVFNLWRMLRSELILNVYSFENVAFHLLHRRVPKFSPNTISNLFNSGVPSQISRAMEFMFARCLMVVEMLDLSELISRNAEFARVYGVDFADVWQRGSQFKVESMMFRIGKPESLLFLTPTKEQVGSQQSAECIPLIMEPQSAFYKDPVVVLDFQSLYPSIMLAYNICYSTCLGRADRLKDKDGNPTDRFGFTKFEMAPGDLELLEEYITISPNGIMFVKPTLRKSLLAKMLGELLDTRVMIKQAMKTWKGDKNLDRTLQSRQLALKLLANVTYGYTSASFSGRMPHIQMADAIVQYGRESLEKAIDLIHGTPEWGSQVVYGDTDSLFIHMPGKSKEDAFRIGHEIADAITARNPKPMKMKFEKVYLPCVLVAKKRYVGWKYEHLEEQEGKFDDKGIETVRRDGIPAQQMEMAACLKILFRTQDLSEVKTYLYKQWSNLIQGRISVQDFTFAKEVRLGGYKDGSRPPHAIVAAIRKAKDPGDEAQYGERVPYIITSGEKKEAQFKRARRPEDLIFHEGLELDADYYIKKMLLPPLHRILSLMGVNVEQWYERMPKPRLLAPPPLSAATAKTKTVLKPRLTDFMKSDLCYICQSATSKNTAICDACLSDPLNTSIFLNDHLAKAQTRLIETHRICASCSSTPLNEPNACVSIDCPVLYVRTKAERKCENLAGVPSFIAKLDKIQGNQPSGIEIVEID